MKKSIFFLFFIFLFSCIAIYAFMIEPKRIVKHRYTLGEQKKHPPVTLVQLSDIHLKKDYSITQLEKIVVEVNKEKPELVVFTGDLFDRFATYGSVEETVATLKKIDASLGKFAVWGNHDYGGGASSIYPTVLSESGFQLLENDGTTVITANGEKIFIAGLDDALLRSASISKALAKNDGAFTVLLGHEPDVADQLQNQNVQLMLSGHSHGGQLKLPFFTVKNTLAKKYYNGFYDITPKTKLYVNSGLGTTKISARLRVPPEIAIFQLYL